MLQSLLFYFGRFYSTPVASIKTSPAALSVANRTGGVAEGCSAHFSLTMKAQQTRYTGTSGGRLPGQLTTTSLSLLFVSKFVFYPTSTLSPYLPLTTPPHTSPHQTQLPLLIKQHFLSSSSRTSSSHQTELRLLIEQSRDLSLPLTLICLKARDPEDPSSLPCKSHVLFLGRRNAAEKKGRSRSCRRP